MRRDYDSGAAAVCGFDADLNLLDRVVEPVDTRRPVTLTASVTPSTATGSVTFYTGTTMLEVEPLAYGQATLTSNFLPSGRQNLTAIYSGDVIYSSSMTTPFPHTVAALPASGFGPEATYGIACGVQSVVVADFNNDGKPDIAFNGGCGLGPFEVGLMLGNGDGTFQASTVIYPGDATTLALGDFNGDGKPDLLLGGTTTMVLLGNGDGTFQPPLSVAASGVVSVIVADFNGDGKADIAVTNDSTIYTLLGTCSWSVNAPYPVMTLIPSSGTGTATVTATIAPSSFLGPPQSGNNIDVLLSNELAYVIPVVQRSTVEVFADVPPSAYYFDAVDLLSAKGITSGCTTVPLDFCPADSITRAEMAIFVVRSIFGGDNFTAPTTPFFNDVAPGDFGFAWIQEMFALGITAGCGDNDFCPDGLVTRAEAAIFLIRARYGATAIFDYSPVPYFTDVPAGAFGFQWIQKMAMDALTEGCAPKLYCPDDPATRNSVS